MTLASRAPSCLPRPSHVLLPLGVLVVFWALLPMPFPRPAGLASNEDCEALADVHATARDLRRLEECSALDPDDLDLLADLAAAHESAGSTDLAVATYERALAIAGEDGDVRLRLAQLLMRRGEAAEAARHATIALRSQPNRPELVEVLRAANRTGGQASR